jgi:tetratricopeptide (TPR) repeat protein
MRGGKHRRVGLVLAGLALVGLVAGAWAPVQARGRTADEWYRLGLAAYRAGSYERAVTCFSQVIELNPRFASAYNDRGSALLMLQRYDLAISDFNRALLIKPELAAAYHNRGLAYTQKKMHWQAISDYSRAIELKPNYAEALNNRGYAYAQLKLYRRALKDYDRALKIKPDFQLAKNNRAYVAAVLKRIQETGAPPAPVKPAAPPARPPVAKPKPGLAAKPKPGPTAKPKPGPTAKPKPGPTASRARKKPAAPAVAPGPSPARIKPAGPQPTPGPAPRVTPEPVKLTPAEKARFQDLVKRLATYLQTKPKDAMAWYRRCYARRHLGRYQEALADCHRAIKLKGTWALAYVGRGAVYRALGQYPEAAADYRKALRLAPRMALAWGGQAWLYATARDPRFLDPPKALASARKAARLSGYRQGSVLDTLARALYLNGRYDRALGWARRALKQDPKRRTWRETLALIQKARARRLGGMIEAQTRRLKANPKDAAALVERCQLYLKLEKYDRAGADCRRAIRLQPENGLAHLFLAAAQREAGHYQAAVALYGQAGKKGAPAALVNSGLAWLYLTAKVKKWRDRKKALDLARRAAKLTRGKNGFVLDTLARAQYDNGLSSAARTSARQAVALDPDNADWRATLDTVSSRRGSRRRR